MRGFTLLLHDLPLEIVLHTFQLVDLVDLLRLYFSNSSLRVFLMRNASYLEVKRQTNGIFVNLNTTKTEFRYFAFNGAYVMDDEESVEPAIKEEKVPSITGNNVLRIDAGIITENFSAITLKPTATAPSSEIKAEMKRILTAAWRFFKPRVLEANVHEEELLEYAPIMPTSLETLYFDEHFASRGVKCCTKHVSGGPMHKFTSALEQLKIVRLSARFLAPLQREFFYSPAIQKLSLLFVKHLDEKDREAFKWTAELDEEALLKTHWHNVSMGPCRVTPKGLNQLIRRWMAKERQIEGMFFRFSETLSFPDTLNALLTDINTFRDVLLGFDAFVKIDRDDGVVLGVALYRNFKETGFFGIHIGVIADNA